MKAFGDIFTRSKSDHRLSGIEDRNLSETSSSTKQPRQSSQKKRRSSKSSSEAVIEAVLLEKSKTKAIELEEKVQIGTYWDLFDTTTKPVEPPKQEKKRSRIEEPVNYNNSSFTHDDDDDEVKENKSITNSAVGKLVTKLDKVIQTNQITKSAPHVVYDQISIDKTKLLQSRTHKKRRRDIE